MAAGAQGGLSGPARDRALLALLVLGWAVSWPAVKVGVATVPPVWYACLRYAIASACLFGLAMARGALAPPPRSEWSFIVALAVLQMGLYSALTGAALTILPPGRASVLAYSTPVWVVPLAAWRLGERVRGRGWLGVGLGTLGVVTLAAPSLGAGNGPQLAAYAMLAGAAISWAVAIVIVRAHRFTATALVLAPWQMLLAAVLLLPGAVALEGGFPAIGPAGAASLAYVGVAATAFAYWAVVEAGRRFPASTLSMALLATPVIGTFISAQALGEPVGASLIAGALLVGCAILLAAL